MNCKPQYGAQRCSNLLRAYTMISRTRHLVAVFSVLCLLGFLVLKLDDLEHLIYHNPRPSNIRSLSVLDPKSVTVKSLHCPRAVRNALGVYKDPEKAKLFPDLVLLTASNRAFTQFLDNWESFAGDHGLKWAVIALDEDTFAELGPEKAVPTRRENAIVGKPRFQSREYNTLVCNKLRLVHQVMQGCQIDVVFSDSDNVFLKDPFQHEFGQMIMSGAFDYIYSTNSEWTDSPGMHPCVVNGTLPREANTGFHFLKHSNAALSKIIIQTIESCERSSFLDDQTLFWRTLHRWHNSVHTLKHCHSGQRGNQAELSICCLDPNMFVVGSRRPLSHDSIITFHANFVAKVEKKIAKLTEWVPAWRLTNEG